ncbi:MAG: hypothetical protein JW958_10215 [Candidatus Eisenbacteria bacterium]|nr:hypothetical protein [Candidatus Eisenbacteria bacterium]
MNDYDINLLRALREMGVRRRPGRLVPLLFAAGLLFYGIHAAGSLGAARARVEREAALLERARDLDRREEETTPFFERRREALQARADRIPWSAVLGSIARAVPPGERLDRIDYAGGGRGRLTVTWFPSGPGAARDFARAVREDSLLLRVFPILRVEEGGAEEADTLLLRRREER